MSKPTRTALYGYNSSGERIIVDMSEIVNRMRVYYPPLKKKKTLKTYREVFGEDNAIIYFLYCLGYTPEEISKFTKLNLSAKKIYQRFRVAKNKVNRMGMNRLHEWEPKEPEPPVEEKVDREVKRTFKEIVHERYED